MLGLTVVGRVAASGGRTRCVPAFSDAQDPFGELVAHLEAPNGGSHHERLTPQLGTATAAVKRP